MGDKIEKLIIEFADEALEKNDTYAEAIRYLDMKLPATAIGNAIKKEVQERILYIALSKEIF